MNSKKADEKLFFAGYNIKIERCINKIIVFSLLKISIMI